MAPTHDGGGYWLVARDGGIFSYGDASFHGSTGSIHLNKPVVGMAATPDGGGYWLVASDGGIFNYGDATFYGSTGSIRLNKPVVGMAPTTDGERLLAGGDGRRDLQLRRRQLLRLDRLHCAEQAGGGDGRRLIAGPGRARAPSRDRPVVAFLFGLAADPVRLLCRIPPPDAVAAQPRPFRNSCFRLC